VEEKKGEKRHYWNEEGKGIKTGNRQTQQDGSRDRQEQSEPLPAGSVKESSPDRPTHHADQGWEARQHTDLRSLKTQLLVINDQEWAEDCCRQSLRTQNKEVEPSSMIRIAWMN